MRVVVGLGNPGPEYARTRHNVGFAVIDELATRCGVVLGKVRSGLRVAKGVVGGTQALLVEPQMYMNMSGAALSHLAISVAAPDLVVIHDDLDFDLGYVRVKRGGGTGGHRGLESIVAHYGPDFTRVRVGIGRPLASADVADYVLSPFEIDEQAVVSEAVQRAADAAECVICHGEEIAMNTFNVRANRGDAATTVLIGRD